MFGLGGVGVFWGVGLGGGVLGGGVVGGGVLGGFLWWLGGWVGIRCRYL